MDRPSRGRPRSTEAHRAILEATRDLVVSDGYDQLTIQAIATRAGVAKQTVYRRWPSKARVVAEAVLGGYVPLEFETRQVRDAATGDLRDWLRAFAVGFTDPATSAVVRALAAAAAESDVDAARLYERFTEPSRRILLSRLRAGVDRGEIRTDADLEAAADAVLGAVLYRVLAPRPGRSDDLDSLADVLLVGLTARNI